MNEYNDMIEAHRFDNTLSNNSQVGDLTFPHFDYFTNDHESPSSSHSSMYPVFTLQSNLHDHSHALHPRGQNPMASPGGNPGIAYEALIERSKLRKKSTHKVAINLDEDINFLVNTNFVIPPEIAALESGKALVQHVCSLLAIVFANSMRSKQSRSYIWSALLDRGLYFLNHSGYPSAKLVQCRNRETALVILDYKISRSNFRKRVLYEFSLMNQAR